MLHVPGDGTDPGFHAGPRPRRAVANRMTPAGTARSAAAASSEIHVRELELPNDRSEVALDLWGMPQLENAAGGRAAPPTWLSLVTKGGAVVKTPGQILELGDSSRVTWLNRGAAKLDRENLPRLPMWWAQPPGRAAKPVEKALRRLIEWRTLLGGPTSGAKEKKPRPDNSEPLIARVKKQVLDVKDPDNQDLGVLFLGAPDEVEPLVDLIGQPDKPNVRGVALFAAAIGAGARTTCRGTEADSRAARGNGKAEAELIVRLLHFYPAEAALRAEDVCGIGRSTRP